MSDLRTRIAALVSQGDHRQARAALAAAVLNKPTTATCHLVADLLDIIDSASAGLTTVKVALLTNYTADPMVPLLRARALPSGILVHIYTPGFNLWMQELLDSESGLRRFDPDVVILDLLPSDASFDLTQRFLALDAVGVDAAVSAAAAVLEGAMAAVRGWSTARLLVHSWPRPFGPSLGILDAAPNGQKAAFARLNEAVRERCAAANAFCLDTDRLVAEVGMAGWHDWRMWLLAKMPYGPAAMHRIAEEHVRYLRAFVGRVRKVLVLDLDDTLWGGVLGERGEHGIQLGEGHPGAGFVDFQQAISELRRRGVVLALNSSNDADHALGVLGRHPAMVLRPEDFSATRINWHDKAQNMIELADELNLGLDSFVFLDNSEAECSRVREALPDVLAYQLSGDPSGYGPWLRQSGLFDSLGYTHEDRQRGELYRGEVQRARHRQSVGSLDDYLASLDMRLVARAVGADSIARAADLTQRTNQFNMTTRRRTAGDIGAWSANADRAAFVFSLEDRFGPQGIIAFASLHFVDDAGQIEDLLISCRALKRNVERAILGVLSDYASARGAGRLLAEFRPTQRNASFAGFYPSAGFTAIDGALRSGDVSDGSRWFERRITAPSERPSYIDVHADFQLVKP